jgi:hypothetical protein
MYDTPFDRSFFQLENDIRHVMPSTDRKLQLKARHRWLRPSHRRLCINRPSKLSRLTGGCVGQRVKSRCDFGLCIVEMSLILLRTPRILHYDAHNFFYKLRVAQVVKKYVSLYKTRGSQLCALETATGFDSEVDYYNLQTVFCSCWIYLYVAVPSTSSSDK